MRAIATPLLAAAALAGCLQNERIDLDGDGGPGWQSTDPDAPADPLLDGGVDLLLVVDDSISMAQEQQMLQTSVFNLVNSLVYQFEEEYPSPVDDVRAAVVSTNLGLSAQGASGDEYWPHDIPGACVGLGDDGAFRASAAASVRIGADAVTASGDLTAMKVKVRGTPRLTLNGKDVQSAVRDGVLAFGP